MSAAATNDDNWSADAIEARLAGSVLVHMQRADPGLAALGPSMRALIRALAEELFHASQLPGLGEVTRK